MSRAVNPGLGRSVDETMSAALGHEHRRDPVHPGTGGPAGNARLTAWLGLALLLLFIAECVTLLSMHEWINVHIIIGGVLVPLSLAKTATTGWRIVRYYTRNRSYAEAGPPPLLLRLLGPLVVISALAVLGTGLALIAVGVSASFEPLFTIAGFAVSPLTLHQASFIVWLAATALHVLGRTVPAVKLTAGRPETIPGKALRAGVLTVTTAAAVICAAATLHVSADWTHGWANQRFEGHPFHQ